MTRGEQIISSSIASLKVTRQRVRHSTVSCLTKVLVHRHSGVLRVLTPSHRLNQLQQHREGARYLWGTSIHCEAKGHIFLVLLCWSMVCSQDSSRCGKNKPCNIESNKHMHDSVCNFNWLCSTGDTEPTALSLSLIHI